MRTALGKEGSKILVCASKSHVVSRMLTNHMEYSINGKWDDKEPFEVNYFLQVLTLRLKKIP